MSNAISICEIVLMPTARAERDLEFWLRIMMEHAIFIEDGLPCEREELREQARQFQRVFEDLLSTARQMGRLDPMRQETFLSDTVNAVTALIAYKRGLLQLALKCQVGGLGGHNYPLLIDHITREAQLFQHVLEMMGSEGGNPFTMALSEEAFWLRQMTDHAKFIASLLDQSERGFIIEALKFSEIFDRLYRQALDYRSMLQSCPDQFPTVARFTDEVIEETKGIRDFKQTAHRLLEECKILSILPPLLADHVMREADHFLMVLDEIKQGLD